ncbi:MAG: response regulator [Holophagales bacterium]|nr:response regulator [Holophagales bacterium]
MSDSEAVVFIVDDDEMVRKSLALLFRAIGVEHETFGSAAEFLARPRPRAPSCLLLDLCMPGLDGLELQQQLSDRQRETPIIFITGSGDVPTSVQAMKKGAHDFLAKPLDSELLLDAVEEALESSSRNMQQQAEREELEGRLQSLTPREKEVLSLVVKGCLNKQIAGRLGATERTVKAHRARVMRKMRADSLAELVLFAQMLGLADAHPLLHQGHDGTDGVVRP